MSDCDGDGPGGVSTKASPLGCSYANPGSGDYASSLCWIDMAGFTTEYIEVDKPATTSCEYIEENGKSGYVCYAKALYESVLGGQYGSWGNGEGDGYPNGYRAKDLYETEQTARSQAIIELNSHITGSKSRLIFKVGSRYYGPVTGWPVSFPLSDAEDSLWFHAKLNVTDKGSNQQTRLVVEPHSLPVATDAALGNKSRLNPPYGFYAGVDGEPALWQSPDPGGTTTTHVDLTDISVTCSSDGEGSVYGYSLVSAEAYSVGSSEQVNWTVEGGGRLRWLPNTPEGWVGETGLENNALRKVAALSLPGLPLNICLVAGSGPFTVSTNTTGELALHCWGSADGPANGAAMVQASPSPSGGPFSVGQRIWGSGRVAVAFALVTAQAELSVKVDDRALDADGQSSTTDFIATVTATPTTTEGGVLTSSASTGEEALESSTNLVAPLSQGNDRMPPDYKYRDGEQMKFTFVAGTDPALDSYTQSWSCKKRQVSSTDRDYPEDSSADPRVIYTGTAPPTAQWGTVPAGWTVACEVTYTPPYLMLEKLVDQADTEAENTPGQWTLTAQGGEGSTLSKLETPGAAQHGGELVRYPVTATTEDDHYSLTEAGPGEGADPAPWTYGYDWTDIECQSLAADEGGESTWEDLPSSAFEKDTETVGTRTLVTDAKLAVSPGDDLKCTYTNVAREPKLVASKTSDPASGSTLVEEETVTYTLVFDNEEGTATAPVDHIDHLADVLDDATFVEDSVRYSGSVEGEGGIAPDGVIAEIAGLGTESPQLLLTGTVPRAQTRVVTFQAKLKENSKDAASREATVESEGGIHGSSLANYLTPRLDEDEEEVPAPTSCDPGGEDPQCTEHPILAWKVGKSQFPDVADDDAEPLQAGDQLYYRLRVVAIDCRSRRLPQTAKAPRRRPSWTRTST